MTLTGHQTGRRRIQCSGRTQGSGCDEPSFFTSGVENQIGELLSHFNIATERRAKLLGAWKQGQSKNESGEAKHRQLAHQLSRLRDLYLDGDLDRADYQRRRDAAQRELDAMPVRTPDDDEVGNRLADYLANLAPAWKVATAEERNRLAQELFSEAVLSNKTAVAIVPRPDVRSFFECIASEEITLGRKRRGSDTHDRTFDAPAGAARRLPTTLLLRRW